MIDKIIKTKQTIINKANCKVDLVEKFNTQSYINIYTSIMQPMISQIEILITVYRAIGYINWLSKGVYHHWINQVMLTVIVARSILPV